MTRPPVPPRRVNRWVPPALGSVVAVALVMWPILAGRLDGRWSIAIIPALGGVAACAAGWTGAVLFVPMLVGLEYGLSLRAHADLDPGAVAEAVGLVLLVELLVWTLESRDYAFEAEPVLRARAVRLLILVVVAPVVAALVLLASGAGGPSGVAALAIAALAAVGVLALVALPRRPESE